MDVRKIISTGLYLISILLLTAISIRFLWINWEYLAEGENTGAFSNLSHLMNALLTFPLWVTAKILNNTPLANKVYWTLLTILSLVILIIPSSG